MSCLALEVGTVLKRQMRDMDVVMHRRERAMVRNHSQRNALAKRALLTSAETAHVARVAWRAAWVQEERVLRSPSVKESDLIVGMHS
jgi:hypothetical protein